MQNFGDAVGKVIFWSAIRRGYVFVFGHPLEFLKIIWPWCALFIIGEWASIVLKPVLLPQAPGKYFLLMMLKALLELASFVAASVALHRAILAGDSSWVSGLRFGRRHFRFLGICAAIAVGIGILMLAIVQMTAPLGLLAFRSGHNFQTIMIGLSVAGLILYLVGWYPISRLILALPAVSVDEPAAVSGAWERSAGLDGLRLYLGSLLCELPIIGLEKIAKGFLPPHATVSTTFKFGSSVTLKFPEIWPFDDAISTAFSTVEVALLVAFYSCAYAYLRYKTIAHAAADLATELHS